MRRVNDSSFFFLKLACSSELEVIKIQVYSSNANKFNEIIIRYNEIFL